MFYKVVELWDCLGAMRNNKFPKSKGFPSSKYVLAHKAYAAVLNRHGDGSAKLNVHEGDACTLYVFVSR